MDRIGDRKIHRWMDMTDGQKNRQINEQKERGPHANKL